MLFRFLGKSVLFTVICTVALCNFTLAQSKVQGNVTNEDGTPLIGVSIIVEGTSTGTITDVEGSYQVEVASADAVLKFSYIGYQDKLVEVGNQSVLNVILQQSSSLLEEVVVVGYGTQDKEDITGAVSSVKGEDFENLPVAGASQALQGRAAGVNVVRNGGAPGQAGAIRIRGIGTVNNAEPLIVIDGVPVANASINDINPNDIESLEVLKDASASAIYGQRAANGVVLITTKRGGFGEKISVQFNAYAGFSNPVETVDVLDAATLAQVKQEAYTNDGRDIPEVWTLPVFQETRTDWQDELLQTGNVQNYDFTIRGGGEKSAFALSGGYFSEEGMMKNSFFDKYYLRINSDHKVTNWLTIGENVQLTRQEGNFLNTSSAQSGILWSAIRFHPSLPVIADKGGEIPGHEAGDYGSSSLVPGGGEFGDINNPIFTADTEDDQVTNHRILGNLYAEFKLLEGLKFRANFAIDGEIFDRESFEVIIDRQIRARSQNSLNRSYSESYSLLGEYFLTYDKTFGAHALNVVGGYTAQEFVGEGFNAQRRDFSNEDEDQRFLDAGSSITGAGGTRVENSLVSAFARLNYAFNDKYLLTGTLRADGSSKFAEGNQWGYFPAFSAGWRISREPFLADNNLISFLKLTAGWGQLGNQEVPGLQYLALISGGRRYSFGGEQVVGSSQSRFPNEDISWETAEMINVGLDIGFLDNRLLANINYFVKDTKDMLLAPPTVGTTGRTDIPDQNVGELRNQGLEIEVAYRNKGTNGFTYSIGANASFIENEVTKLFEGSFLASRSYGRPNEEIARTFVGSPIGTFYGWRADGLYGSESEINSDPNLVNDPRKEAGLIQPGDVRFLDLNGDGLVDSDDRTILGDPFPALTYGLNAQFGYKGFDLGLFFLGVSGVDIYNADRMQGLDASYPFNLYADAANRWTPSNTGTDIPRATVNRDNRNFRTSDLFIEDGSFLRLKNLTVGYTFPSNITSQAGISNLRVYITGQNIFTATGYSGVDPELGYPESSDDNGQVNNLQANVDYAQYPQPRTWTFGLSVGF